MKRVLSMVVGLALSLGTCATFAADHEVKMLNTGAEGTMVFEPGYIKVAVGDTVTFKSVDPAHNSVSHLVPDGATTWEGQLSQDISVTFDKEGVYIYKCVPHMVMAMVGVVQVGNATNKEAAAAAAKEMSKQFALNKDRLENYMAQVQ